jgi:hypothetical protein
MNKQPGRLRLVDFETRIETGDIKQKISALAIEI